MKNWLKVLLAVMLAVTCVFSYASCNTDTPPSGGNTGVTPPPGVDDEVEDTTEPDDSEFMEDAWQIKFHYSYTAQIVNENDRTENKQADVTIATIYVPYDEAVNGWTADLIAKKDDITYHGYKFESWYPAWDADTQSGWNSEANPQVPVGDPYDFESGIIDRDIHLYAHKGDIAGDDINWSVAFDYETDDVVADADENSAVVTFVNIGWADSLLKNAVNKVAIKSLVVGKTTGWTPDLLTAKDAIRYDGYSLTWYSAWDETTMTPIGGTYEFVSAPTENITLYGVLGERDAEYEDTEKTLVSGVLKFTGSGAMYGFNDANTIDVPWYGYKDDITEITMDDEIVSIGKNAFANFTALKTIEFSEAITLIDENAFYKCDNTSFRTLRLPPNVITVAKQAFANTKLNSVILNDGIETLGDSCFSGSNLIASIVVPTSLKSVGTAAFFPGTKGGTHALSKIYYMGTEGSGFRNDIKIGIDNEPFKDFAALYCYKENNDSAEVSGLYWYFYPVDGVVYPAQYSYALKYKVGTSKVYAFTDFVPVAPIYELVQQIGPDGEPVYDEDGVTPVYIEVPKLDANTGVPLFEGTINESNLANYNSIMNAEIIKDENGNVILDIGYGFTKIEGINDFNVGIKITSDRELTCARADYVKDTSSEGILGGGIEFYVDQKNGVITVTPSADGTNEMWNFKKSADVEDLWYGSALRVTNIKKIIIEDGVKSIGDFAFAGTGVKEVVIPASVTKIAPNAFVNCSSLLSIYYEGTTLPETLEVDKLVTSVATVYVKTDVAVAEDGAYWMVNEAGQKTAWSLENGALYIGGDDVMLDFATAEDAPWYGAKDTVTSVTVARNIVSLGKNMIFGYSNVNNIVLSAALKYIPESALAATGLVNNMADYERGMLVIDGHLIKVDPARRNNELFVIPTSVSGYVNGKIDNKASVVNIAEGAFSRCDDIKAVFICNTVQSINANAFDDVDLKQIFVDSTAGTWADTIAKEFDYRRIPVFYKGQYTSTDGVYAPKNGICNHVYDDEAWTVKKPATCLEKGSMERPCIFGCGTNDVKEIPKNENAHALSEELKDIPATCLSDKLTVKECTNFIVDANGEKIYCNYYEIVITHSETQLDHEYDNVVAPEYLVPGTDDTYYKSCVNGCGIKHESETFNTSSAEEDATE